MEAEDFSSNRMANVRNPMHKKVVNAFDVLMAEKRKFDNHRRADREQDKQIVLRKEDLQTVVNAAVAAAVQVRQDENLHHRCSSRDNYRTRSYDDYYNNNRREITNNNNYRYYKNNREYKSNHNRPIRQQRYENDYEDRRVKEYRRNKDGDNRRRYQDNYNYRDNYNRRKKYFGKEGRYFTTKNFHYQRQYSKKE